MIHFQTLLSQADLTPLLCEAFSGKWGEKHEEELLVMAAVSVPAPLAHFKQDDIEEIVELEESEQAGAEDGEEESKASESSGGKFKLGLDSGSELLDELTFSLEHCAEGGAGQPPPGHWGSQPHGKLQPHLTPRVLIH